MHYRLGNTGDQVPLSHILITGGAGFIGTNYAVRLIRAGHTVTVLDNLSRAGSAKNLRWLQDQNDTSRLNFIQADVRDFDAMIAATRGQEAVFHLAAQVAVTTSIANPREDFEINALGTLNVLEAARLSGQKPLVVYASTNKVYGSMADVKFVERDTRWEYLDLPRGLSESYPLDFHSPYGCSKGAGDQYVHDYARIYDIPTVVFRQSCIYGPRQFGVEDQGWLAHFAIEIAREHPISIYGDGKQVRDMLWVDDLLDAYDQTLQNQDRVAGRIYNIGGGCDFTFSIWREVEPLMQDLSGRDITVHHGAWRPGDQKVYISDISAVSRDLGWLPTVTPEEGLNQLWEWVMNNIEIFET